MSRKPCQEPANLTARIGKKGLALFAEAQARGQYLGATGHFQTDRLLDLLVGEPVRGAGDAQRSDHLPRVVADRRSDAAQTVLERLAVGGVFPLAGRRKVLQKFFRVEDRVLRVSGKLRVEAFP